LHFEQWKRDNYQNILITLEVMLIQHTGYHNKVPEILLYFYHIHLISFIL
jgi:hypothetical protein